MSDDLAIIEMQADGEAAVITTVIRMANTTGMDANEIGAATTHLRDVRHWEPSFLWNHLHGHRRGQTHLLVPPVLQRQLQGRQGGRKGRSAKAGQMERM